ncbi:hypothetical protein NPIL_529911, partial [Nephila pilipes]
VILWLSWFAAIAEGYKKGESKYRAGRMKEEAKRRQKTVCSKKNVKATCPVFDRGSSVNSSAILTVSMIMISLSSVSI